MSISHFCHSDCAFVLSPFTDPVSFATLSFAIESGGEAAYLGASLVLQNSSYLEVAAVRRIVCYSCLCIPLIDLLLQTIAPVEARQASWVSNAVLNGTPWNGPFDTPLTPSNMISLASKSNIVHSNFPKKPDKSIQPPLSSLARPRTHRCPSSPCRFSPSTLRTRR